MALTRYRLTAAIGAVLLSSAVQAKIDQLPASLQTIADQGVTFVGTFEAPGNLTGYVGEYQGQGLAVYTTADGQHALVGTLIDSSGRDMGADHIRRLIDEPRYGEAWNTLQDEANWFIEGDANAPNIVYTFTDPFCPYCQRMHEMMRPYIESGEVQLRHIMVGIIREASPAIAATIIGSDNPMEQLLEHMQTFADGGITMQGTAMRAGQSALRTNHEIMRSLNLSATPASFYKDKEGVVRLLEGAPQQEQIRDILVN